MIKPTFQNHNYKVIKPSKDWKQSVIQKDNITANFTIAQFEENIERMEKTIKELEAKYAHEKVVVENVRKHHPFVRKLTDLELHTAWMYKEAQEVVKQYAPRIREFKMALATEKAEIEHVKSRLGLDAEEPSTLRKLFQKKK